MAFLVSAAKNFEALADGAGEEPVTATNGVITGDDGTSAPAAPPPSAPCVAMGSHQEHLFFLESARGGLPRPETVGLGIQRQMRTRVSDLLRTEDPRSLVGEAILVSAASRSLLGLLFSFMAKMALLMPVTHEKADSFVSASRLYVRESSPGLVVT